MSARLFEQTESTNPNTAQRIAFGRAGYATQNMTIANLLTYLLSNLGFLKVSQNLADLNNAGTARTSLSVYSIAEMDAALGAKQATITAVGWNNATDDHTDTSNFLCKVNQYGGVVTGNGTIQFDADLDGDVVFKLPTQVTAPTVDVYFASCQANGSTSETSTLKIAAGTRNVYAVHVSQGSKGNFNFSYVV